MENDAPPGTGTSGAGIREPATDGAPPRIDADALRMAFEEVTQLLLATADRTQAGTHTSGGDVAAWGSHRTAQRHFMNYYVAAKLLEEVGHLPDEVADVGCGTAAFSRWLAGHLDARLYLSDTDPRVLRAAIERVAPDVAATEVHQLPPADLVTAMEVVEHVPYDQQERFVASVYDRVRPGGWLVMSTPDESAYPGGRSGYAPHIGTLTADGFEGLLREATGQHPAVWRLGGGPFTTSALRRWVEWVVNHTVGRLPVSRALSILGASTPADRWDDVEDQLGEVRIGPSDATGDGLVAAVRRPVSSTD